MNNNEDVDGNNKYNGKQKQDKNIYIESNIVIYTNKLYCSYSCYFILLTNQWQDPK
jgi:hypothetical protein